MKKILAIVGLGLISSSFALDEYLSIEKGKVEVDAGYSYTNITGFVDKDWKKHDNLGNASPTVHMIPLQIKYGITPELDLELASNGTLSNKDAGDMAGFSQPEIAAKYTVANLHAGAYLNIALPFTTGNLDKPDAASLGIALGGVYANRFGNFRLTGTAGYRINLENKDKKKPGNALFLYAKPEAMWTEYIGTYLGFKYILSGETESAGTSNKDSDKFVLQVIPGVNAQLLKWLAYEVNAPIDVMGKNGPATWGIGGSVYATLPM